ncbi:hypothetical protein [Limnoglobus roseus]|uniref:Uncharacterized protein n=1 Tax=Limnoglobus roseus TaxID=2598579 RepID=A0A5C1AHE9_9BACT|nr:hypothetical protein [Limnoglobus roseus]QEL17673.1 hypothetical protein PX52LOC_04671 [Limnoglobus roseus]
MTEAQWWACKDVATMLKVIRGRTSDRKRRLFSVGCCRRIWGVLTDPVGRHAVDIAERHADGNATGKELTAASRAAALATADYDPMKSGDEYRAEQAVTAAMNAAAKVGQTLYAAECCAEAAVDGGIERAAQSRLLRDIFGNPFRLVTFDSAWLTPTAVGLAEGIYADRAFDRMPILADAMQDAGCEDVDVLSHCRGDGRTSAGAGSSTAFSRKGDSFQGDSAPRATND